MVDTKYVISSLIIFIIALLVIIIIVISNENKIKQQQKDEYKMFASFGGTPNISQIRRPWGRVAMGPDYC
jgi:hypothetical protein